MDLETDNDSHSSPFSSTSSSSSLNLPTKSIMAEDDIVELFGDNSQAVRRSQTQKPTSEKPSPPPILRGSGSGGGEGNAPLHEQPSHHNIFIQEDEMASWFHQPHFYSDLFYSAVVSNPFAQPPSSVSLPPPPPPPPPLLLSAPYDLPHRPTGGRPEAGPSIPVVRQETQVVSSAIPSSSATEFSLTPATLIGGLSHTFAVPGLGRKENPVATDTVNEIAGTSSLGVSKAEKEPIQIQPATATKTEIADDKKRKEREETIYEIEESKEAPLMSRARKRSRAAEMHNISERRRREKINEKMKALQELIPRCNKSNRASILDDAIEYVKSLQMQIQMMPMGGGMSMTPMMPIGGGMSMTPMMYAADMQRFMAMGVNRPPFIPPYMPFPRQAPMAGFVPSYPAPLYRPFPNIQASQPSRVHLPSQQPDPLSNQPHDQFAGLHQRQEPPSSQDRSESAGATP